MDEELKYSDRAVEVQAILCPICQTALDSPEDLWDGQDILCPYCQQHFDYGQNIKTVPRYRLGCPHCGEIIEFEVSIAAGQRMSCVSCGGYFLYPEAEEERPVHNTEVMQSLPPLVFEDITESNVQPGSQPGIASDKDFTVKVVTMNLEDSVKKLENSLKKLEEKVEMSASMGKKGLKKPMLKNSRGKFAVKNQKGGRRYAPEPVEPSGPSGAGVIFGLLFVVAVLVVAVIVGYKYAVKPRTGNKTQAPIVHHSLRAK